MIPGSSLCGCRHALMASSGAAPSGQNLAMMRWPVSPLVASVHSQTAGGTMMSPGSRLLPGWLARVVEVALPDDGSITMDLRQEMGERRFTLRIKDLPIALPDRKKDAVGVLKTEEVKDGDAVEVAQPFQVAAPKPGF